jgi:ABC-type antimicrobial peptide transport system permease subunit
MKLALAEMRRNRGRFGAIMAALVLIVFLVLVLNGLADGLYYGATGAIRTSGADLYVFAKDGRHQLARSTLPATSAATIAALPGVTAVGPVGTLQGTGHGPTGIIDLVLFGYTPGQPGGPAHATQGRLPRPGEAFAAAADSSLKDKGITIGDTITFSGTSRPITIVGFTSDSRYELQPTLWTSIDTWRAVRNQARPEFQGQQSDVQAFAVRLAKGASATKTASAIDTALRGQTETIDRATAVLALPGVKQQRSTFNQIIYTTFVVAAIVIALFFALITLEKRTQLAILKAVGASSRYLATGILVQSLLISVMAAATGIVMSRLAATALPSSVPVTFRAATAIAVAVGTVVTGALGAAFSFRRVTRINPATALGGA